MQKTDRRNFLKSAISITLSPYFIASSSALAEEPEPFGVLSYASDPKDVDSVNTHLIEAPEGLIVVDMQRLLPEAQFVVDIIKNSGKPVAGLVVTHAHTDHYGGLPVFSEAFPNAPIFTSRTVIDTITKDTYEFNSGRKTRHAERFPSQDQLDSAVSGAQVVTHGERLEVGGISINIIELTAGEADASTILHLPEQDMLFPGDLVQNKKIPMPFHSHENWLAQLNEMVKLIPKGTKSFQGHGTPTDFHKVAKETSQYLTTARDLVASKLRKSNELDDQESKIIEVELITQFPFHVAGGGVDRSTALRGLMRRLSSQIAAGDRAKSLFAI